MNYFGHVIYMLQTYMFQIITKLWTHPSTYGIKTKKTNQIIMEQEFKKKDSPKLKSK